MSTQKSLEGAIPHLYTVKQFSQRHPVFSEGALRSMIFQAQPRHSSKGSIPSNGLEVALVHVGRRVLINEEKFFTWLEGTES